jgi:hypothetical protein
MQIMLQPTVIDRSTLSDRMCIDDVDIGLGFLLVVSVVAFSSTVAPHSGRRLVDVDGVITVI